MNFNKHYKALLVVLLALLFVVMPMLCFGESLSSFSSRATYRVCFTPGNNCAEEIIKTISQAKKQILIQAYIFNDMAIAKALVKAKRNGIDIRVILDKSQTRGRRTVMSFLRDNKVELIIADYSPTIAHSKVMIVDKLVVIGGSYNYTKSAAKRNTENMLIIKDAIFAQKYIRNWNARERESAEINVFLRGRH